MSLPAGVVTFLFTDIEGSTRLFQAVGDEYPMQLEQHNRIIREAVAAHDGHEISTEGDAFFIAFASPADAVAAAVDAQRGLAAYAWPRDCVIRARMGLHTGEARPTGDNYVALAVHQAARVAGGAHGGQIVVSDATMRLCATQLPDVSFTPLGAHVLRDFPTVESLHQVLSDGLQREFPPLRTPTATTNLPRPRTSFIGREAELTRLTELTENSSLVTLTGTGGTGKTRLSIELARRVAPRFQNGVVWVDLAARTDPDLVPQAVAEALGIGEQSGRVLVHTLVDHLCLTSTLIVIDNCEHLIDAVAAVVEQLLDHCARLAIVATSREPLGIAGEVVYRVPSLTSEGESADYPPAVELFVDRARHADPGFVVDDDSVEAITTICLRLDGIPLAIELAASRVRGMSVRDLATRIEDRFALLSGGARTALPRQQTLRGLVDWSYELLADPEREVFRRISVFNGRFPLHGVEAVCADIDVDALQMMARLVDKSLVNIVDTPAGTRYVLLQTIRHYAFERLLDSGAAAETRTRHGDWCALTVHDLPDAAEPSTYPRAKAALDELVEDVRATFDWCASRQEAEVAAGLLRQIGWYFAEAGLFSEARRRGETILEQLPDNAGDHAAMLEFLYDLAWHQGDYPSAVGYARRQVDATADASPEERATALHNLGTGLWRIGELDESEACFRAAMQLEDSRPMHSLRLHNIGLINMDRGDTDAARTAFHESMNFGDAAMIQVCWMRLAVVALREGELDEAQRCFDESLSFLPEQGHPLLDHYLGELALARGDSEEAERRFASMASTYTLLENSNGAAYELLYLGRAAAARADYVEARRLTEEALATFEKHGDLSKIAEALADLARLSTSRGDVDDGFERWRTAVEALRRSNEQLRLGAALIETARAAIAAGQPAAARETLAEAAQFWAARASYPIAARRRAEIAELTV